MARKRNDHPLRELTHIVALFPWWVGVLLAAGFYIVLHHYAVQPAPVPVPGQIGAAAAQGLLKSLAFFGQYLVPAVCLIGAAFSAWKRRERQVLVDRVAASSSLAELEAMTWKQFEHLVGEAFRLKGFSVADIGGGGPDGGVDLVLTRGSERFLVQCKQWKALKVGVEVVRDLYGVVAAKGATGGFVVTSGEYTREARAFAEGRNLTLINGLALQQMIASVRRVRALENAPPAQNSASSLATTPAPASPNCPVCGKIMARRIARRGSHEGRAFWGCSNYPNCKGTRTA